ncbi:hypothetical protein CO112_03800 [Candidatus Dojkabacteria bacterium CG_4_9_14_3_um_filter_150_Dojkabacteria_WS6_41_13]|uniref:Uncharacterized protein n=1 Tax=Candidatus Dojkabacteria bacterium CG_4_10_14_0_2_um_filter_Dojkabacteria_WS6_41_15 TaxID=2014249 RepID=A0A2M7W1Q9_9BACT|nr:MAG: hypothetical protein COZ14_02925 [Candidatus Dojkabacteria bacterium CG_4_10_14_3_um_filter_Dojkabacteria_WS6_41_9]PJA13744.1 MAG: hypothetical protein COX64_02950 [Candidatus Dojkabacteria bacterium CG_4_10_14_0_2_um_filter_Dojkabacteria_WS6_41_15]PJB22541.1 MAG: hypothetical protein CO112_03800 [Candidatus Dojkabacteria bacterium CG_4_9_14_3_um_filter_150_Dojkabacteria_WS6_41_13]
MNMTEFWFKFVDMTKSDTAVFSLGGISISEKQIFWIVVIVVIILLLLLLRNAVRWVFGVSDKPKPEKTAPNTKEVQAKPAVAPTATNTAATPTLTTAVPTPSTPPANTATAQELLTDTSDRKRSLNDFVTPDSIHADVVKQTLTNDFPYQTLKPDASKIGQEQTQPVTVVPATPTVQEAVVAPVVTAVPAVPITAPTTVVPETPKVVTPSFPKTKPISTLPPLGQSSAASITPPATTTTTTTVTSTVAPPKPEVVVPVPTTPLATAAPILPPIVATPADPSITTPTQVVPPTPPVPSTASSVLPPLPVKVPDSPMVVGVADEKAQPVKTTTFNPTDPIIP